MTNSIAVSLPEDPEIESPFVAVTMRARVTVRFMTRHVRAAQEGRVELDRAHLARQFASMDDLTREYARLHIAGGFPEGVVTWIGDEISLVPAGTSRD